VVSGLTSPTNMTFLGDNDFFVVEKATGKVDHVINGVNVATKFDMGAGPINNLPVNNNSERGLLGIALSPNFANDHNVYLDWTENNSGPAPDGNVANTPVLGNRVDRFIWNSDTSTLTFDKNLIRLHSFQQDGNGGNPAQMQGNHNGGVIQFGPDGKLYIVIGDNGRRGWMQNLINGPTAPGLTDENNGAGRRRTTPTSRA
jgi:glucose/arabinose dehydrogenase